MWRQNCKIFIFHRSKKNSMRGSLELREISARKLFSRLSVSFLLYFEIFQSKTEVRTGISLTASKRTYTVKRYIDRTRRKRDAPVPRARDSTDLQHHFRTIRFLYLYLFCKNCWETLYTNGKK